MTFYADSPTDAVSEVWKNLSEQERKTRISEFISELGLNDHLTVTRALDSGVVYVSMVQNLSPDIRGTKLLDLEEKLKQDIDVGINIWCEPIGDKNSLRNLRGVQIIS